MAHGVIRAPSPATGSKVAVHMGDPTIPIGIERWQNATADNQQKTLSRAAFCRPVSFSILPMPEPHSPIAPALLFWKECEYRQRQEQTAPLPGTLGRGAALLFREGFCQGSFLTKKRGWEFCFCPRTVARAVVQNNGTSRTPHRFPTREPAEARASGKRNKPRQLSLLDKTPCPPLSSCLRCL